MENYVVLSALRQSDYVQHNQKIEEFNHFFLSKNIRKQGKLYDEMLNN